MADNVVRTPTSSTGIIRFYDTTTGGPMLDPRSVLVASILFIVFVKLAGFVINP